MLIPAQITFRKMSRGSQLEADILARARSLERYYPSIMGCRVVIEPAHRRHEAGNRFHVRIDLRVPGEEIVVSHDASLHASARQAGARAETKRAEASPDDRHARVAIRKAFEAARRQLQDYGKRQRGVNRPHEGLPIGRVVRLLPGGDGGFIGAPDGHEIYFHRNSVLNEGFGRLDIGTEVAFAEEKGDRGPQASTVKPIARRGAPVCGIVPLEGQAPEHRPVPTRRRVREPA